jgi:hypothetical protein
MATLVSPGVSVTVSDESQYVAATQGTLPLLVIATASNKTDASGSATAVGTSPANAGVAFLVSSQRELTETFGEPKFYEVGGSVVQGAETSEYGLLAAYQYLGVSNNAYVIRADVDLAELEASSTEPAGVITSGTHWHDISETDFGLFKYDGTDWVAATATVLNDPEGTGKVESIDADGFVAPISGFGSLGDLAIVTTSAKVGYYEKTGGTTWTLMGEAGSSDFQFSKFAPTKQSDTTTSLAAGDLYVRTTLQGGGLDVQVASYSSTSGLFTTIQAPIYSTDDLASADLMATGDIYTQNHATLGYWELKRHSGATTTSLTSGAIPSISSIVCAFTLEGEAFSSVAGDGLDTLIGVMQGNTALNTANVSVEKVGTNKIRFTKTDGKELNLVFSAGQVALGFTALDNSASVWEALSYQASATQITGTIAEGTLWYNASLKVEILKNTNVSGSMTWVKNAWSEDTETWAPQDLQLVSSAPTTNKAGGSLVAGDIWMDSDAVPYPTVYRHSGSAWVKLDNADQSSTNGVVFSHWLNDAPYDSTGTARDDTTPHASAANPDLHPEGILMINMDYSTYNVKKYTGGKWEWASGVNTDGSGKFGSVAQRHMVVEAMQAAISANTGIRSEAVYFNLIAAPGYHELMDEMITLNKDKKETAFVIGDCDMTLKSDSTSLKAWATANVPAETYAAIYYPHGLSTDLSGNDVVIPSSAIALRTYAFSDQVSFPWFAPAGLTRGVVSNASQLGYVNSENEFVKVQLSEGQRDVLYTTRINPIADFPNTGMAVYGQKTCQATSTALDRVNVARLTNYMRHNLDTMSRSFLFEQNDKITRDNMRDAVERFCGGLVTDRGLYDFLVVCDDSNNTPARIDRNELWVDVAIQPAKAVEFIYIPLRIRNTGESLA